MSSYKLGFGEMKSIFVLQHVSNLRTSSVCTLAQLKTVSLPELYFYKIVMMISVVYCLDNNPPAVLRLALRAQQGMELCSGWCSWSWKTIPAGPCSGAGSWSQGWPHLHSGGVLLSRFFWWAGGRIFAGEEELPTHIDSVVCREPSGWGDFPCSQVAWALLPTFPHCDFRAYLEERTVEGQRAERF